MFYQSNTCIYTVLVQIYNKIIHMKLSLHNLVHYKKKYKNMRWFLHTIHLNFKKKQKKKEIARTYLMSDLKQFWLWDQWGLITLYIYVLFFKYNNSMIVSNWKFLVCCMTTERIPSSENDRGFVFPQYNKMQFSQDDSHM